MGSHIDFGFISSSIEITNTKSIKQIPSKPFSDHADLIMIIKTTPIVTNYIRIKNYKKAEWNKIQNYVSEKTNNTTIQTECNLSHSEIDSQTDKLTEIYNEAIEKYVPNINIKDEQIVLSNCTQRLIKEKKTILRKKFRNINTIAYSQICIDLKQLNYNINKSIKNDF